jgi:hypothetical protein
MTTTHDDLPHPVPPFAFLRWKENWFFIVMAPESGVHGVIHLNFEPSHDRARFTCHLSVQGKVYKYVNETVFPERFALERSIGDGRLIANFLEPQARIALTLNSDELDFDLLFEKSRPAFDYAACRFANPGVPSFQEVMTLGTNLPYNHQQQAMTVRGSLKLRSTPNAEPQSIAGYGYRDHSWCMRADSAVASHTWSGLHFGSRAFGVKKLHTQSRPEVWAREGYVSDADGERALKDIEVLYEGKSLDGLPRTVRFQLADVYGKRFTVVCDVAGRYAQVPLVAEKPGKHGAYGITENFCPAVLQETGETGCALVEIGDAGL